MSTAGRWTCRAIIWLPAALLSWRVATCAVNVPFWDQLFVGPAIISAEEGTLSFDQIWEEYNDSRKVFPRLIFIALAMLSDWDVRWEMAASIVVAVITSIGMGVLLRRSFGTHNVSRYLLHALANLIVFSPIQSENWLWGIQLICFMPICAAVWALIVLQPGELHDDDRSALQPPDRSKMRWRALLAAAGCAVVATFSYANGLILWGILLPAVAIWCGSTSRQRAMAAGVWCAIALGVGLAYFSHFTRFDISQFYQSSVVPIDAATFFLRSIGAPLGLGWSMFASSAALLAGAGVCALTIVLLRRWYRDRARLTPILPWLLIGSYGLVSIALMTAGRFRLGPQVSMFSRYTTFSSCVILALLIFVALRPRRAVGEQRRPSALFSSGSVWFVLIVLLLFIPPWLSGWRRMGEMRTERLQSLAQVQWALLLRSPSYDMKVDGAIGDELPILEGLDRHGLLARPLIRDDDVSMLAGDPKNARGAITRADLTDSAWKLSGWAALSAGRPADAVIVSIDDAHGVPRGVALVTDFEPRATAARKLGGAFLRCGWSAQIPLARAASPSTIRAWAFDAEAGVAYLLDASFTSGASGRP